MFSSAPTYVSSRSADVILSDVRPIKLSADALQAINVLLDELLYNILGASRSLSTDNLKGALSKVLPTSLGKEALLEAEVELKAYWERTTPNDLAAIDNGESEFDHQWCFELLRLKCEAYSTMNDSDEDADAERRLNEKMSKSSISTAPKASLLAPAALYLTAIMESTCEHVLSNVGRVAARDSSRSIASVHDMFVAICEDDAMYGMFRTMKVYEQIEVLSRAQKPRRSKSFSRSTDKISTPSRTSSPLAELGSLRDSTSMSARLRMSSESLRSNATTVIASPEPRTSSEKARSIRKLMGSHSRTPSEKVLATEITKAQNEYGMPRGSAEFEEDYALLHEFDELMRSGATMKVSLTPDRLKSMEVYNKERIQRANRRGAHDSSVSTDKPVEADTIAPPSSPKRTASSAGRPSRNVDSIIEDEEETSNSKNSPTTFQQSAAVRVRQGSLSSAAARSTSSPNRLRSISISNMPHPRHEDSLSRKTGISNKSQPLPSAHIPVASPPRRAASNGDTGRNVAGQPQRKRKVARRRESIDLDDVMGGSDDGTEESVVRSTPVPKIPSTPQKLRQPYVSQSARDLIAFLEEGPPDEPQFPHSSSANASVISFESSKTKTGRFSRMMSKLSLGGSTEKLNGRDMDEPPKTPRSLGRKPSRNNLPPPPAYLQQTLNSKRSMPNVAPLRSTHFPPPPHSASATQTTHHMQLSPASPPRMLHTAKVTPPPTASSSQTTSAEDLGLPTSPSRRATLRKAVPVFDDKADSVPPIPKPADADSNMLSRNASNGRQVKGRSEVNGTEPGDDDAKGGALAHKVSPRTANGHTNGVALKSESHEKEKVAPAATRLTVPRHSSRSRPASANGEDGNSSIHTHTDRGYSISPEATPGPTITAADVDDLRRLLLVATTADECRLLTDMFFARNGFPYRTPPAVITPDTPPPTADVSRTQLETLNNDLERSLVELFLGGNKEKILEGPAGVQSEDTAQAEEVTGQVEDPAQSPQGVHEAPAQPSTEAHDATTQYPREEAPTQATIIPAQTVVA
ncbi:hypothetical protein B0H21DRAFT_211629 [Amylocystis lapponica]|nr:hypothetical protein B0H21DRAFT_211629 [Amylocystis lapponica]